MPGGSSFQALSAWGLAPQSHHYPVVDLTSKDVNYLHNN